MATALTAAAQPQYGRIQLMLTWTTVTSATVSRVHPDGTVWPVRGADPTLVASTIGVGWVGYDHEAPLDQPVTYRATSTQAAGTTVTSAAVTVPSSTGWVGSMVWITHPLFPALSVQLPCEQFGDHTRPARAGLLQIINRADQIGITDTRLSGAGQLTVATTTAAETTALRNVLADGTALLIRSPSVWALPWFYAAIGDVTETGSAGVGTDPIREWQLPYTVVAAVAGAAAGAYGVTYADIATNYATYTALAAGKATYNAVLT